MIVVIFLRQLITTHITEIGFHFAFRGAASYKVTAIVFEDCRFAFRAFLVSFSFGKFVPLLVRLSACKIFTGHIFFMVFVALRAVAFVAVWACHVLQIFHDENSTLSIRIRTGLENLSVYVFNVTRGKIEKFLVDFRVT